MKIFPLLIICLVTFTNTFCQETTLKIPEGWRTPNKYDIKDDWEVYQKEDYIPYHFTNDFDQNELKDEAWILIKNDNTSFGVWVLLKTKDSQFNYLITEVKISSLKPQFIGISKTEKGTFQTACGKGYFDCEPGDPSQVVVTTPQLWYSPFESGPGYLIMWNKSEMTFRTYQMTD